MTLAPKQRQKWRANVAGAAVGLLVLDRLVLTTYFRAWHDRAEAIARYGTSVTRGEALLKRADILRQRWASPRVTEVP